MIPNNLLNNHNLINIALLQSVQNILDNDENIIKETIANLANYNEIEEEYTLFLKHNSWGIKKGQIVRKNNFNNKEFTKLKKKQLANIAHRLTLLEKDGLADLDNRKEELSALEKSFEQSEREQSRRLAHRVEILQAEALTVDSEKALSLLKASDKLTIRKLQKAIGLERVNDYKNLQNELKSARLERFKRYEKFLAQHEKKSLEYREEQTKYERNHYNHLFGKHIVEEECALCDELNRLNIEEGYIDFLKANGLEEERLKKQNLLAKENHLKEQIENYKNDVNIIVSTIESTQKVIFERYRIAYQNNNNKNLIKLQFAFCDTQEIEESLEYALSHHYDVYNGRNYNMLKAQERLVEQGLNFKTHCLEAIAVLEQEGLTLVNEQREILSASYEKNYAYFETSMHHVNIIREQVKHNQEIKLGELRAEQKQALINFETALGQDRENIKSEHKKRLENEKTRLNRDLTQDNRITSQRIKAALKK